MDPQPAKQEAPPTNPKQTASLERDILATLHQLVSQIDTEDRLKEVVEKARHLKLDETQLLIDCLSMALDKDAAPSKTRAFIWRSLINVASFAKTFAQNHTLRSNTITAASESSSGIYNVLGAPSAQLTMLKQTKIDSSGPYSEPFITWAHVFHPNIIPLFAVFLDGKDHDPCLVSPRVTNGSICDYVRAHREASRMLLISDVINGLSYVHQLGLVHGALFPSSVLTSDEGRALISIPSLASSSQDFDSPPIRYSAPELLGEDDSIQPDKATDIWSFACLCYEVLSGKVPFFHIAKDFRVLGAVTSGSKPIRPGRDGVGGDEIEDVVWQLLLMCWGHEPADRPLCLEIYQIILGMGIQDSRPGARPILGPNFTNGFTIDVQRARDDLKEVLGSDQDSSLLVPKHLRDSLFNLIPDTARLKATAAATKQFSPGDTQHFVDFLDLLSEEFSNDWYHDDRRAVQALLSTLTLSTRILPQRYKLNGMQYNPQALVAAGSFGKAYKGRSSNIRINVITYPSTVVKIIRDLPKWTLSSHPNVIPFLGVFYEGKNDSRFCLVTPLWMNGNLHDYARTLPQKSRIPLIFDVIKGLNYMHAVRNKICAITPKRILVSDQGHAVITVFGAPHVFAENETTTYELRFTARGETLQKPADIWSFGCICYEVLSRRSPYYQYTEAAQIRSAVIGGEVPRRPDRIDGDIEEIGEGAWNMIMMCCNPEYKSRPDASTVLELVSSMVVEDDRPEEKDLHEIDVSALRSRPHVDYRRLETLLGKIQVELLRGPLSKLIHNRIKGVAAAATNLQPDDTRILVDFLDLALGDYPPVSEERNRVLALLSKIMSSTRIFPQRYEVKGIRYHLTPIAEGGFGSVHEGLDLNMCVKIMTRVDPKALAEWVKELILWAHSSHPNVLPFCGVFLESTGGLQRICLVSPFMKNGNLDDYASRLPPISRLPLILDVINGLYYLHRLGIVHGDLKGQNVLISDEGRGLITDFGASRIVTVTAAPTASTVYSTLRFAAPELMLDGAQLSQECDIWSFGCLCYQVLSRKPPYNQYVRDFQVAAALSRKEPPKRPGPAERQDNSDGEDWDSDEDDEGWDAIDDQAWNLITKCCAPEPQDRLKIPAIQELIADMKVWDNRPAMKAVPGAEIFKLRLNPEIDLSRARELLDRLQKAVAPDVSAPEVSFHQLWRSLVSSQNLGA